MARRLRRSVSEIKIYISQSSDLAVSNLLLNYLYRFLLIGSSSQEDFFKCLDFAFDGLEDFTSNFRSHLIQRIRKKTQESIGEVLFSKSITGNEAEEILQELNATHKKDYSAFFEEVLIKHEKLIKPVMNLILSYCEKELKKRLLNKAGRELEKRFNTLANYFSCSQSTVKILKFTYVLQMCKPAENLFEDFFERNDYKSQAILSYLIDITDKEYRQGVEDAQISGLIDKYSHNGISLTDTATKVLQSESKKVLDDLFYTKLKTENIPLEMFTLEEEQKEYVSKLLLSKDENPVHILLYGEPGTGKTCFASNIADKLGFEAWSVVSREEDSDSSRRSSLVASRHLMIEKENTILIVDEAERLLDTNRHTYERSKDKAWLNNFLEKPKSRVIWISNEVDEIDQAVRRRFSYSVQFKKLTKEQRIVMWQEIIKKERVLRFFKHNEIEKLVDEYDIPVALISNAIKQSKILEYKNSEFIKGVRNYLNAYITLANNGYEAKKDTSKKSEERSYTLEGVSLEKGSRENLKDLMVKLKKVDAYLKEHKTTPENVATMLFYGPPGTGKSALAKYIAQELDRKCIIKRASDILGMYVGESEKNIRNAFETAEKDGAVLVIDEADSFIFSRESAVRSWETSAVNEFLTSLESFKGICICTTNRRENMDSAAMRRFAFKVGFTYAGQEQVISLYETILSPLIRGKLSNELRNQLLACKYLTAGDFAAVRSQFWLYEKSELSHTELVSALVKEQTLKLDVESKKIGF